MSQKREPEEKGGIDLGQIVNSAITEGIDSIIKDHPRFEGYEAFLMKQVDKKKLNDYLGEAGEELQKKLEGYENPKDAKKELKDFYDKTAKYIPEALTEKGKELILRNSSKKDAGRWFFGVNARKLLKGEDYLDKTMGAFSQLYELSKSGDYAQRHPEFVQAVSTVYDMGFFDTAVNVLYQEGKMNKKKYHELKKVITERTKQGEKYVMENLEQTVSPNYKKAAAIILGLIGVGILLSSNSITGNVIGNSTTTSIPALILGAVTLILGGWLGFKRK